MLRDDPLLHTRTLLRTRLAPPRRQPRLLPRPALTARLREALDYRLTLVQAGTGYGKSTALADLAADLGPRAFWYSAAESDAEPARFLAYLIGTFQLHLPKFSDWPQAVLQEVSQLGRGDWAQVVDVLVNALSEALQSPALLIVDDYHFAASPEVAALAERFIAHLPPQLHVLLATRLPLHSPALTAWRVHGELLEITRETLVFTPADISTLFHETYGLQVAPPDIAALADKTEGWPIALQLVWQGLRERGAAGIAELLASGPASESLSALFEYLAHEVLGRQPPAVAAFLRDTAVLRELTPGACAAVAELADAPVLLQRLHESDLFVVSLSERHSRYHHLFHDFLRQQWAADPEAERERHRRAADYFTQQGDLEEAIYHDLAARRFEQAAFNIEVVGESHLRAGRAEAVAQWIDALPPETLATHPLLQRHFGDVCRLRSRFDEALAWYQQAERLWRARGDSAGISRALRGQALVYLDTVRPAQAESLLEEALRHTDSLDDRETRARMFELLAENKLNLGKAAQAEQLRQQARALRDGPDEDALSVRVKLRTGRLDEAQRILEDWQEAERGQVRAPRGHRETALLLSLIYTFRGHPEPAIRLAAAGIRLGELLNSPFVSAVAHIRLAHALQLQPGGYADAIGHYQAAITLGDQLAVRRVRAEAMWGLTRAYGFAPAGDVASAERAAAEGVEVCRWAGDPWLAALCELTLAATYVLTGRAESAIEPLGRVLLAFRECGDSFGRAAARLWQCLAHLELNQPERFAPAADELLALGEAQHYDFLFTHGGLLSPPDPRRLVPLLVVARQRRLRPAYVNQLLAALGLPEIKAHPGYQLRVQTLGAFRVWRGAEEVEAREWKRDKARQLFQLLLTQRQRPFQREEITERLWPALTPEAAGRDFKVALNALYKALEPARAADAPSAYIARDGAIYLLRPEADLWLDAAEFERATEAGLRATATQPPEITRQQLQTALTLYTGDYLPEALYEDWASEERERLLALYLRAADKLAGLLIEGEQYEEGLATCRLILSRDICWERAYRLMMLAHARQGNRPQALRVYQLCQEALRRELDVAPSPATLALHERIVQASEVAGPV
jgi:ATP/maltotriose-dependent transcriptional regulator MalT/DNA-binding SARP family transcriptional activator